MFYGKMTEYAVASPIQVQDRYNYLITSYQDLGTAKIYIVLQDRSMINNNLLQIYKSTLVGYTGDRRITKGWKIDNKYIVTSSTNHRTMNVLYLEELNNGR